MGILKDDASTWSDIVTRTLYRKITKGHELHEKEQFSDLHRRTVLVAKARWIILLLIGIYGACAGSFFYFSRFGFFLTHSQQLVLLGSVLAVVFYNSAYHFFYGTISRIRWAGFFQILLDILFVTILIHFSGGVASWFWPVYLLVTIEAAFLLDRTRDVWVMGAVGGVIYGTLLAAEYAGSVQHMKMPFVAGDVHLDYLHLVLMWSWVAILNTTAAVILTFLMSVIRLETRRLRQSEERLLSFIDAANDLIVCVTPKGEVIYVNEAWRQDLGYSPEESAGTLLWDMVHPHSRTQFKKHVQHVIEGGSGAVIETTFTTRDGQDLALEGAVTCSRENETQVAVWGIFRDITERKIAQEQLYYLAHYDTLTNLPNRAMFVDWLKRAKAQASRSRSGIAIMFLDLDRFKIINDTLGHPVGDKLLQSVAKRLSACMREVDTVARIGGDEFIIVAEQIKERLDADKIAQKVLSALSEPYLIDEHELFITTSLGISLYPDDDEDLDNLIKKADIAMYAAKSHKHNTFKFYDASMDEHAYKRFTLENGIRKALENDEFRLHYQPKVNIVTGEITAMEALLRWEHPDLGLVSPVEFIPVAEETGLILPLGEWVLNMACIQNKQWQAEGLFKLRIAVNISGHQLQQKNFVQVVKQALEQSGLEYQYLELEITETVIMQSPEFTVAVLSELKEMGIHISIDDFGTGYSSLSHLKRFSVNTLKIDKSFVRNVVTNVTDATIAKAIISLGSNLNLNVIAEGVETEGQLSFLRDTMCDEIQGYLFSRPMTPEKVVEFMKEDTSGMLNGRS
ncbi:bifunctional diguanylate cyclase/phosphodiesterase [Geobacter sp. DSM 9736]|uniref:putative bifunctional diguanylate cyclase/phosphodiesterase n=1 Tax=Geobacter sp. DSM 9736 TaxID=1277350 RepID=UPI000B509AC2|nr:EAL domain-containing protein [Geobacter sp. DSM 9736]SNB47244.1 PAS domain S-box-containing protein/diguanylate cyclase (GGDEF) domain-containing protein [Geobacter sp. DSM 9736]